MHLKIKIVEPLVAPLYREHGHFHEGDCGLDVFVAEDFSIEPGETKFISTGICCEPEQANGYYLMPRSSIAKTKLRMANSIGLIDKGYRGVIAIPLDNIGSEIITIKRGTRLAQLVSPGLEPITFEFVNELTDTNRGTGGFGSTGK